MIKTIKTEKFQNFFRRKFCGSYIIKQVIATPGSFKIICDGGEFNFCSDYMYDLLQEFKKE